jgi:hypothetical protein
MDECDINFSDEEFNTDDNNNDINPYYIKPLEFYIKNIKNKNIDFNVENIKNYDDLFNSLINYLIYTNNNMIDEKNKNNNIDIKQINNNDKNIIINNDENNDEKLDIQKLKNYQQNLMTDFIFLINNSKEIENLLNQNSINNNNNNNINLQNNNNNNENNNIILKYEEKIFFLEKELIKINNQKIILENDINEIKKLFSQFESNYSFISPFFNEEDNNNLIINKNNYKKITKEICQNIIKLYSNKLFNESFDLWKKYNFQKLENFDSERNFDILSFLVKVIERNNKKNNIYSVIGTETLNNETKKKNLEIVELMSQIELLKFKLSEYENKIEDLNQTIFNLQIQNENLIKMVKSY